MKSHYYKYILKMLTLCTMVLLVSLGIEPGGIVFPSQNNNIILQSFCVLRTMWELEIFSSRPGRLCWPITSECHVDCPFPVMWLGNVWEPAPSPRPTAVWAWTAYLTPLPGLNPQIPLHCHMDLWSARWFSPIYTFINFDIFPYCNFKIGA